MLLILMCFIMSLTAQVNGDLSQANGKWILRTYGTHTQRGYAQGYLLAEPIMSIMNGYYFQMVAMSNPTVYNDMLNFYLTHFEIGARYQAEAQGIVNGILASGADATITGMSREIMMEDVLLANCLVDMYSYRNSLRDQLLQAPGGSVPLPELELGCASLSSWGSATAADTLLAGHSVITRFMDWNSDEDLIANPLLLVSFPSEPDEQPWVSFTYPGMIGALSSISASGKAAFLNMGNVHNYNNLNGLHPILLSIRNAIESRDYNADGSDDIDDILSAIYVENSLSGSIIHVISETPEVQTGIIETNNQNGTVMRTVGVNSGVPGMNLAATNHFRMLASPVCCSRYENIIDSLQTNPALTAKRQKVLLTGAAGQDNNMMSLQYTPSTGRILWSTSSLEQPAHQNEMTGYLRDVLLDASTGNNDNQNPPPAHCLRVYPNPALAANALTFALSTKATASTRVEIYNLKGQKITTMSFRPDSKSSIWNKYDSRAQLCCPGVYIYRLTGTEQQQTGKFVILD